MKTSMRNLILVGVAGVTLVSASLAVAGGFGPGCSDSESGHASHFGRTASGHGMMGQGRSGPRHAGWGMEDKAGHRLGEFKKSLQLTPDQEAPWNEFAAAVEAQAKRMGDAREEMFKSESTMPERMDLASKLQKEREQELDKISKAMKTLYEALTPEQRKVLDQRGPWMHG